MYSTMAFMRNAGHLCECGNHRGGEMRPGVVPLQEARKVSAVIS